MFLFFILSRYQPCSRKDGAIFVTYYAVLGWVLHIGLLVASLVGPYECEF